MGQDFGGGAGRGGTEISDEIGDGEINLMAHRRNHRNFRGGNGTGHHLFVEAPEIFQRPTTPGNENNIQRMPQLRKAVQTTDGRSNFLRGSGPLHPHRIEDYLGAKPS